MKAQRGMECWAYVLRHSAELGRQSWQLYEPVALYFTGNTMVLISVGGWVDPNNTEFGLKEYVT
jgi:hypothetical protein